MAASTTLKELRAANTGMKIKEATDRAFEGYGRVIKGVKPSKAVTYAKKNATIRDEIVYEPSVKGLEADRTLVNALEIGPFGGMPVQIGWCFGRNNSLDGLEYHKGIEVVVAVTDTVVLLGDQRDIAWKKDKAAYASKKAEAFFLKAGAIVEFHCWCLHFAPIHVRTKTGFLTLVALPKGTNTGIKAPRNPKGEDRLLFARNKWLLVHRSAKGLVDEGATIGITGANTKVNPIS
jgi:hypothetical protein